MPGREASMLWRRWGARGLAKAIEAVDREALAAEYAAARAAAPRRHSRGLRYLVEGHDGRHTTETSRCSGRLEEHLAVALWRTGRRWGRADGSGWRWVDYQVPLKARRRDRHGKVDLVGVEDGGRLVVTEMKVGAVRRDSPPGAVMQGLRYAAVVEANAEAIGQELAERGFQTAGCYSAPLVQVLAPKEWWGAWLQPEPAVRRVAGPWEEALAELLRDVGESVGVEAELLVMEGGRLEEDTREPRLRGTPTIEAVALEITPTTNKRGKG